MDHPPPKLTRVRPRHSLCEFEPYQCDRPRYLRSRFCDAHICEMQTLRSHAAHATGSPGSSEQLTVDVSPPALPDTSPPATAPPAASAAQPPPSPVIQCQYRVRRYERRCRNPVPPDGGDVHFCAEHRARVASRRENGGPQPSAGVATGATGGGGGSSGPGAAAVVVGDYTGGAERWAATRRAAGGGAMSSAAAVEAHHGHEGLAMPRGKEERGEWKEEWDSDAESPASDDEDVIETTKNAGAYSLHELLINAMFHRRKLMLLYQEQMAYLRRILQHDYAVYEEVRRDHRQMRTATNTIIMRGRQAQAFRATRKFKRYSGAESLLHDKSKRVRLRSVCPDKVKPSANPQRCAYNDPTKDEKCPERVLPLCKFCPQHILHQANQSLFAPCATERCDKPVLRSAAADEKPPEAAGPSPDELCAEHRPDESLLDFLPTDAARPLLEEALSGLTAPPHPPPEAMAAAREAAAAAAVAVSPDKARGLRREDSMTLHEPFDLNLFIPDIAEMDMAEMDSRLMEEALSVLRSEPGGEAGGGGGAMAAPVSANWEDLNSVIDLCQLLPGDELEPLETAWQRLMNPASVLSPEHGGAGGGKAEEEAEERQGEEEASEERVEEEVVAEDLDLVPAVDPQQEQLHLQELRNLQSVLEAAPGGMYEDVAMRTSLMEQPAAFHAMMEEAYDGASPPLQPSAPNPASLKAEPAEMKKEPVEMKEEAPE